MPLHPVLQLLLKRELPNVVRVDIPGFSETPLTTYTFTDAASRMTHSPGRFGAHENVLDAIPQVPSVTGKGIFAMVHGTDSVATFNVSSVTIGGVAGTELVDRGGATNAANSAIYGWSDSALADITTFDVVVTWSEAITACSCILVEVSNIRSFGAVATGSATGTGAMLVDVTGVTDPERVAGCGIILVATTLAAADPGVGVWPDCTFNGAGTGPMDALFPQFIYKLTGGSVMTSADVYYLVPGINGHGAASIQNISIDWPGTDAGDVAAIYVA